jgi:hypothetical protein
MNVAFALNAGGEDLTTTVTQDGTGPPDESNANQWISIGGFEAGPSIPLTLTLSDWSVTGPSNGGMPARMVAGASRLVLIEERPAPPTAPELVAVEPDAPPAPPPSLEMTLAPDPEIEVTLNATPTDMPEPEPTEDFPPLPLAANIAWLTEPNVALSIANASDRELVIFIHAPGDRDAMQMLARAWSDPEVISLIADRYVAAQIDLDRHRSFCAGFGITRGPSVVRHDTSSGAISRLIGRSEANALRELLE